MVLSPAYRSYNKKPVSSPGPYRSYIKKPVSLPGTYRSYRDLVVIAIILSLIFALIGFVSFSLSWGYLPGLFAAYLLFCPLYGLILGYSIIKNVFHGGGSTWLQLPAGAENDLAWLTEFMFILFFATYVGWCGGAIYVLSRFMMTLVRHEEVPILPARITRFFKR